ncbi:hypothetical protein EVAR_85877_1 [Eumeta japonica]|uniref:Uncharacterized protein n=1 Tax=Eumeta variegata TaxID=151549 RepID=A0A4C2A7J0_EUMVA|nr:hypothetical protein EVAR_85877_1 [Eumeta japonica]
MSTNSQSRTEEVAASHIKKAQNPRLRTLQSRMVKRPLRVQTDLSEAGSVKSDPNPQNSTQVELRRCATQKVKEWEQASCPVTTRNRRRSILPPSQPSESKIEERRLSMLPRTKKGKGRRWTWRLGSKRTVSERQRGPESAGNMKRECKASQRSACNHSTRSYLPFGLPF